MEDVSSCTALWRDYERGKEYQDRMGLSVKIPVYVRFYEGNQWPAVTADTRSFPRPVVNIVKMICRNKKAAILSTPVRIRYHSDRLGVNVKKFNDFSDYIVKEMKLERKRKTAVKDGSVKGTYATHYYWDAEAIGKGSRYAGALRCECIDMLHIFVADPTEVDEQKQKWILIVSREDVATVREKADADVDKDLIVADEPDERYKGVIEQENDGTVTVLTRYFKKDGEVWCEKGTQGVVFSKPKPIAPDVEGALRELRGEDMDAPNNSLPDDASEAKMMPARKRMPLYPIVIGQYDEREGSIYGIGEVEGIINNQREINFGIAMSLLNAQVNAWGKYVADEGALGDQVITNEPGQTLIDKSKTGNGIRTLPAQPLSSHPMALVDSVVSLTRSMSGATEVMTGETVGANMSGQAIALLQSQTRMPVSDLRDMFWLNVEKEGEILAQFFKNFYEGQEYVFEDPEAEGEQKRKIGSFSSSEFRDVDFTVVVEATSGTNASTAGDIALLDTLFARGAIDAETYIHCYPSDAVSNRDELLEGLKMAAESEKALLSQRVAEYEVKLTEATELIAKQNKTVDSVVSVINENKSLQMLLASLYNESVQKLSVLEKRARTAEAERDEAISDARDFSAELIRRMGGDGGNVLPQMQYSTPAQGAGGTSRADLPEPTM